MKKIVTKKILDIYFKYDEDLSLLHERWANKKDRDLVSNEQANILGKYIDKLEFLDVKALDKKLREETENEVKELEKYIEQSVIETLRD